MLHFEDEEEYRLFLRKRRAIWIASGLFAFFAILALVSAVLCLLWLKRLYWLIVVVIVAAMLAAVIMEKMENPLYERYKNLTYNLVFLFTSFPKFPRPFLRFEARFVHQTHCNQKGIVWFTVLSAHMGFQCF